MDIPKPGSWIKPLTPKKVFVHKRNPHLTDHPFRDEARLVEFRKKLKINQGKETT